MGRHEDGHVPARPARSIARVVARAPSGPGSENPPRGLGRRPPGRYLSTPDHPVRTLTARLPILGSAHRRCRAHRARPPRMDGIDATGPEPGAHSATGGSMAPGRSTVLLGLCATALLCATSSLAATRVTASDVVVVVQPGDTLVGLAARYGTSVSVIATLNDIANPDLIRAGQRIRVTVGRTVNARRTGNQHHVVRPGETLTSIAADFGTTIEAIAAANRLTDPSYVWAGRRLVIPSAIRSK